MDDPEHLPDRLTVGGLTVRVQASAAGPLLAADDPDTQALAFVVNAAFQGPLEELAGALEAGRSVSHEGLFAIRPSELDGPPPGADAWRELSGTDPGDDSYIVGTNFLPRMLLVPREVLRELLERLGELRA